MAMSSHALCICVCDGVACQAWFIVMQLYVIAGLFVRSPRLRGPERRFRLDAAVVGSRQGGGATPSDHRAANRPSTAPCSHFARAVVHPRGTAMCLHLEDL